MKEQLQRFLFILWILIIPVQFALSQDRKTKNNYTGNWETPTSWDPAWIIPQTDVNNLDVTINGYITANSSLTFTGSKKLIVDDTLVIRGNLEIKDGYQLQVNDNGILIVRGNMTFSNTSDITSDGYIIITGNLTKEGSVNHGSFKGDEDPIKTFIGGTVSPEYLLNDESDFESLNCLAPEDPYPHSGCSYGNMDDLINDPVYLFFLSTCGTASLTSSDADNSFCAGTSVTFTSGGGINYNFRVNGTSIQDGGSPTYTTTTLSNGSIVDVIVTSSGGCIVTSPEITNTVFELPVATATSNSPVCAGSALTLTGGPAGMTTYSWTGPNGFTSGTQSPTVSPAATSAMAGIYSLTVTNASGCTSTAATTTVVINALPVATATSNSPVCAGSSLTLEAGPAGMTTYSWTGPNGYTSGTQSPTVSPAATLAMAGVYSLTVTNASGCTSTAATTTVVVNALPVATATSNSPVCSGSPLTLTGGPAGMTSYSWTGPNGFTAIIRNPTVSPAATLAMAGVYSLTVTNASGCTSTAATTTVVVNALPVATATSNSPVCAGSALTLTGGPAGMTTYSWTGPNGFTSGTQSPTVSPAATSAMAGIYSLTVTNASGCTSAAVTTTVVVNALPVATATSNSPVCSGSSLTLAGGPAGMTTYSWTGPNGFTSGTQSPTVSPAATLAMAGVYSLTVTNASGCTSTAATTTVVVNALPAATATSNSPVCVGSPLTLTGGPAGMTTYSWTGPNGFTAIIRNPTVSPAATLAMAGVYSLTVTNASGCTSTAATTTVVVNALPVATATSNSPVCSGSPLTLTGGPAGMTSYSWTGPNGFTAIIRNPTVSPAATLAMAGVYSLTVTNASGCTSTAATTTVVVNALPVATATSNSPVCAGSALTLTGGPAGMTTYSWTGPNGFTSGTQSPTVSPAATSAMAGIYSLTVTNASGCTSTAATTTAVVNALPVATATSNSPVCSGSPLTLAGGPAGMTTYSWTGPNGFTSGTQSPTVSPAATSAMAGVYSLTVTNASGCTSAAATTTVVVNALPAATATSNSPVCSGSPLTLTGGPAGMTSYSWTGPNGFTANIRNPTVSPAATLAMAGIYSLTVTNTGGCTNSAITTVTIYETPVAYAGPDKEITFIYETQLEAELFPGETGIWSVISGSGLIEDIYSPTTRVSKLSMGENIFLWKVIKLICEEVDDVKIKVNDLFVPSVITPNGDGRNDFFKVDEYNGRMELIIFNRWGNEEFRSSDYQNDWDGRNHHGAKLPTDTYFYILKVENGKVKKGSVLIKL